MKEINNGDKCSDARRFKTTDGKLKSIRVWWVPEVKEDIEIPKVEFEEEVPF